MPWVAPAMAIIGTAVSLYGVKQAEDAKDDAKAAAETNVQLAVLENKRQRELQKESNEILLAQGHAAASASGTSGVSENIFMRQLKKKGLEELKWLDTVGQANVNSVRAGGQVQINRAQQNVAAAFGQFSQASVGAWGEMKKANWI